jgi:hypothetical protein
MIVCVCVCVCICMCVVERVIIGPPQQEWGVVRPLCATSRHQYDPPSSRAHPDSTPSQGVGMAVGWQSPAVGTHSAPTPIPRVGPHTPVPAIAPSCYARNAAVTRASRGDLRAWPCSGGVAGWLGARCRRSRYQTHHAHYCNYCDHCNYRAAPRHRLGHCNHHCC